MNESDRKEFASIMKASMEVYDKTLSADALRVWWATLTDIDLADVRHALTEHIKTSPYAPKPADVLDYCRTDDGRPGAEEAWAMIPKDEDSSVIWTEEMAAAFGSASPLLNDGDSISARMAFKESYEKELDKAWKEGRPVKWSPSFGRDKMGREAALSEAVEKKRLSAERAIKYMPESEQLAIQNQNQLEYNPDGQKKIRQLMSRLTDEKEEQEKPDEQDALKEAEQAFSGLNEGTIENEQALIDELEGRYT